MEVLGKILMRGYFGGFNTINFIQFYRIFLSRATNIPWSPVIIVSNLSTR